MPVYNLSGTRLFSVYNISGVALSQAYDIQGNELLDSIIVNDDDSIGTPSGYSLTANLSAKTYVLRMLADFNSPYQICQSFCYNPDLQRFYKFDGTTTVKVYDSSMSLVETVTLPSSPGHTNDACYYNGNIYFPSGYFGIPVADATKLYVWGISANTISSININGIEQPTNGSERFIAGICETERNSGKLYLVCQDATSDELVHTSGDKLSVYEYIISSGTCVLKGEFSWDCVYVQGATMYDGILYVACNTQTTTSASNYKGITLKAIRTDTWSLVDELTCAGNFEPEGMDTIPIDSKYELSMGMNKYQALSQVVRFTPPYSLTGGSI